MTSTLRNEITIKPSTYYYKTFYLHRSQENKRMAHHEIISKEMKFLHFLFECFCFYGRFVYVGSVLFWCFRCQLEQLLLSKWCKLL